MQEMEDKCTRLSVRAYGALFEVGVEFIAERWRVEREER